MELIIAATIGIIASLLGSYVSDIWSRLFKRITKVNIALGERNISIELGNIENSVANVRDVLSIDRENPKVFLSYTNKDKELAQKIAEDLIEAGINVWLDVMEIQPGDSITKKIEAGLRTSQWYLQILSPESANSEWMHKELSRMVKMEKERKRNLIIPIVSESLHLPDEISDRAYVNLGENYEVNVSKLIDSIKFRNIKAADISY